MSVTPNPIHAIRLSGYSDHVRKLFQVQKAVESTLASTHSTLQQKACWFLGNIGRKGRSDETRKRNPKYTGLHKLLRK